MTLIGLLSLQTAALASIGRAVPPAEHTNFGSNISDAALPHRMCLIAHAGTQLRMPAAQALGDWLEDDSSNVAVIYGEIGQGKTWLLDHVAMNYNAKDRPIMKVGFEKIHHELVRSGTARIGKQRVLADNAGVVLMDNYDAVNSMTGDQTYAPDVRELSELFAAGFRVMIATRRAATDMSDELNRQLNEELRYANLGVRAPFLLVLDSWSLDELADAAVASNDEPLRRAVAYLRKYDAVASSQLRRPLMLQMLARSVNRIDVANRGSSPSSLAELYTEYVGWALTIDYDRGQSRFRESHKRQILTIVAYDIFSGQQGTNPSRYSITYTRLAERVMEIVAQDAGLRIGVPSNYEWTQDFLSTNHLMTTLTDDFHIDPLNKSYVFIHPTFFEYFVAQGILMRIRNNVPLGARPETLSEATIRSMALYFVREYWSTSAPPAKEYIARRNTLWTDRLLLLRALETVDEFGELIKAIDPSYFDQLEHTLATTQSSLVKNAMKYQLVIAGRYSAFDYVDELREIEAGMDTAAVRQLLTEGDSSVTIGLVKRLRNPSLAAAVPITVYRLGQVGDGRAAGALTQLARDRTVSAPLRGLAVEAINRLSSQVAAEQD